MLDYAMTA